MLSAVSLKATVSRCVQTSCYRRRSLVILTTTWPTWRGVRSQVPVTRPDRFVSIEATMDSQAGLVHRLRSGGWLNSERCMSAVAQVDRTNFIASFSDPSEVYQDYPLPIGCSETISAPHMHATALEVLESKLQPGNSILDAGSGSGYLAACMAYMVKPDGRVLGIEKHQELADISLTNIRKANGELLDSGLLEIRAGNVLGDGLADEWRTQPLPEKLPEHPALKEGTVPIDDPRESLRGQPGLFAEGYDIRAGDILAPYSGIVSSYRELDPKFTGYDAIHVGAAADEMPTKLCTMLKPGGLMLVPIGATHETQILTLVTRDMDGTFRARDLMPVRYVPLTRPEGAELDGAEVV